MVQIRRGHTSSRGSGGHMIRLLLMAVFLIAGIFYVRQLFNTFSNGPATKAVPINSVEETRNPQTLLSHSSSGELIKHQFYTLSYVEKYEQAEWVSYELTKKSLQKPNVKRTDWFEVDAKVSTGSAKHSDYSGSGYTRGHLVPAGDMAFDKEAMEETFLMSNMSPQLRAFNNGIWRELEEQVRDWVYQNDKLCIISGPVFKKDIKRLKRGNVAVPDAFFKVIADTELPDQKGVAFLIPHAASDKPLQDFMITIDSLESITGINFFNTQNQSWDEKMETKFNGSSWPISTARYRLRVSKWNLE